MRSGTRWTWPRFRAFAGSSTGEFRPVVSPNDGKPIAEVEVANVEIGLRALAAVEDARKGAFGKLAAHQRAKRHTQTAKGPALDGFMS